MVMTYNIKIDNYDNYSYMSRDTLPHIHNYGCLVRDIRLTHSRMNASWTFTILICVKITLAYSFSVWHKDSYIMTLLLPESSLT